MINEIKQIDGYEALTPAQIVDAVNAARLADASNYVPVTHERVKAWLSEDGLSERLKLYMRVSEPATDADLTDPAVLQLLAIRTGIDNVLTMGPGTELLVAPGDGPRLLLDTIVGVPTVPVSQSDHDRLIARSYTGGEVTEAEVTAALDAEAERVAAEELQAARTLVSTTLHGEAWNTHVAPVLDGDINTATVANLVAGLRAMATAIEGA